MDEEVAEEEKKHSDSDEVIMSIELPEKSNDYEAVEDSAAKHQIFLKNLKQQHSVKKLKPAQASKTNIRKKNNSSMAPKA